MRLLRRVVVLTLLLASDKLLTACVVEPEDLFVFRGDVYDDDGTPLEDTTVDLYRGPLDSHEKLEPVLLRQLQSDSQGRYAFEIRYDDLTIQSFGRSPLFRLETPVQPDGRKTYLSYIYHGRMDVEMPPLQSLPSALTRPTPLTFRRPTLPVGVTSFAEITCAAASVWLMEVQEEVFSIPPQIIGDRSDCHVSLRTMSAGTRTFTGNLVGRSGDIEFVLETRSAPFVLEKGVHRPVTRGASCDVHNESGRCAFVDDDFTPRYFEEAATLRLAQPAMVSTIILHGITRDADVACIDGEVDGAWKELVRFHERPTLGEIVRRYQYITIDHDREDAVLTLSPPVEVSALRLRDCSGRDFALRSVAEIAAYE